MSDESGNRASRYDRSDLNSSTSSTSASASRRARVEHVSSIATCAGPASTLHMGARGERANSEVTMGRLTREERRRVFLAQEKARRAMQRSMVRPQSTPAEPRVQRWGLLWLRDDRHAAGRWLFRVPRGGVSCPGIARGDLAAPAVAAPAPCGRSHRRAHDPGNSRSMRAAESQRDQRRRFIRSGRRRGKSLLRLQRSQRRRPFTTRHTVVPGQRRQASNL